MNTSIEADVKDLLTLIAAVVTTPFVMTPCGRVRTVDGECPLCALMNAMEFPCFMQDPWEQYRQVAGEFPAYSGGLGVAFDMVVAAADLSDDRYRQLLIDMLGVEGA